MKNKLVNLNSIKKTMKDSFYLTGLLLTLFLAVFTSFPRDVPTDYEFATHWRESFSIVCWSLFICMVLKLVHNTIRRRKGLHDILFIMKDAQLYEPIPGDEIIEAGHKAYLGIDTQKGTMLYIRFINNKSVEIMGFDVSDWSQCKAENLILRIYTHYFDAPCITIRSRRAGDFVNKMEEMQASPFLPPRHFARWVKMRAEHVERDLSLKPVPYTTFSMGEFSDEPYRE